MRIQPPPAIATIPRLAGLAKPPAARPPRPREAPLPVEIRRPMAGAYVSLLFGYMGTLPDYARYAWVLWAGAALAAGAALWQRSWRTTLVGAAGALLCVLAAQAVRMSQVPDLALPVLVCAFAGTMMGTTANSSLRETVGWIVRLPSRARRALFLLAGAAVLVAAFAWEPQALRSLLQASSGGGMVVMLAVAASVVGALAATSAGWGVGRVMRRLVAPAAPDGGQTLEHWEALSRW